VAKLVKLDERLAGARRDRIISKDAGDLLRLFRYCDASAIGSRLRELVRFDQARPVIYRAVDFLEADLGSGASRIADLAAGELEATEPAAQVAAAVRGLGDRLLTAYRA